MAKYNVKHGCGCVRTVELFGKLDARYSSIARMEKQTCKVCQRKEADAKGTKYNMSDIMRRAWAIVKSEAKKLGEALRQAWAEAKAPKAVSRWVVYGNTYAQRKWIRGTSAKWDATKKEWYFASEPSKEDKKMIVDLCGLEIIAR